MPTQLISHSNEENSVLKFIRSLDQLGLTPQFLIEGKRKYNTISGGLLSLIIYIFSLLSCFFFGKELYLKEDPTVIISNSFDKNPRLYNLTAKNFNFFLGIEDINFVYFIDPSIYTVKMSLNQITLKEMPNGKPQLIYNATEYDMERCNLEKHFKNFKQSFETLDLTNLLCLDQQKAEFQTLPLAGGFGEKNYQYIRFIVRVCKNGTNPGVICKPKEVIDKKLEGGFFVLNYIETIFDPKNYTRPDNLVRRDFYTSTSNSYFKEIVFWMKNVDYISDAGILMSSEQTQNYLQTDYIKETYDFRTGSDIFLSVAIRLSFTRDIVKRSYLKIQGVIAQVGGFIKGIMLFVSVLNQLYSTTNFYIFLMNKLYTFENLIDSEKGKHENYSINKSNNLFQNSKEMTSHIFNDYNNQQENKNKNQNGQKSKIELENSFSRDFKKETDPYNKSAEKIEAFIELGNKPNLQADSGLNSIDKLDRQKIVKNISSSNFEMNNTQDLLRIKRVRILNQIATSNRKLIKDHYKNFISSTINESTNKSNNTKKLGNSFNENKISLDGSLVRAKERSEKENDHDENRIKIEKYLNNKCITHHKNQIKRDGKYPKMSVENTHLHELKVISDKICNDLDEIVSKFNKSQNQETITYKFSEKLNLMFSLCFGWKTDKESEKKKTLKQQKQFIFQNSYRQITEKFNAFKYLKIFEDVELIKNILFSEDQLNVINIISETKQKYKIIEEIPVTLRENSLKNIAESQEEIDNKIKFILNNTHLL